MADMLAFFSLAVAAYLAVGAVAAASVMLLARRVAPETWRTFRKSTPLWFSVSFMLASWPVLPLLWVAKRWVLYRTDDDAPRGATDG